MLRARIPIRNTFGRYCYLVSVYDNIEGERNYNNFPLYFIAGNSQVLPWLSEHGIEDYQLYGDFVGFEHEHDAVLFALAFA